MNEFEMKPRFYLLENCPVDLKDPATVQEGLSDKWMQGGVANHNGSGQDATQTACAEEDYNKLSTKSFQQNGEKRTGDDHARRKNLEQGSYAAHQ